jgi:hypothetical protein
MAAIASRWFRRKASQRLPRSGSLGARFIQREMVLSERSKPSMRSSPWIRGAPHVEFSTTMRKINSRTSFGVGLLPTCLLTLEISRQYIRKPVRCQRTTVSGVTMRRDCFQAEQTRRAITQKNLSNTPGHGRGRRRFSATSSARRVVDAKQDSREGASPVLRQNSVRTENSAIPCPDGCLIQVIPSPSDAKHLSWGTRAVYLYI